MATTIDHAVAGTTSGDGAAETTGTGSIVLSENPALTGADTSAEALTLASIDQSVFAATLVDAFVYDTRKDSDGGAWRQRCAHTSWENETLVAGAWLGSAANEAAARALSGAAADDYYYDTTAGVFYSLDSGSGVTQVYRGNVAKFPALALITVEAARVIIWDLTQPGAPMWMVFVPALQASPYTDFWRTGRTVSSVAMLNGVMLFGTNGASDQAGVKVVNFAKDSLAVYDDGTGFSLSYTFPNDRISARNSDTKVGVSFSVNIVDQAVNAVAMTVLDDAPIDAATGLPIPTIAVATDGGVSVITDTGSVWDITATSYTVSKDVMFRADGKLAFTLDTDLASQRHVHVYAIPTADVSTGGAGYQKGNALEFYANQTAWTPDMVIADASGVSDFKIAEGAVGHVLGLSVFHPNPASPADGMVAYVTKDYTSGWMVGDIKGAWLADTTAETVSALFESDGTSTTGWVAGAPSSLSLTGTQIKVTTSTGDGAFAGFAASVETGKTYRFTADADTDGTSVAAKAYLGTSVGSGDIYDDTVNGYIFGERSFDYVATFTGTVYFWMYGLTGGAGAYILIDSAYARPVAVDRSVNANGLQVFGSLTKAAVASGAELVGYSGFSATDYLEQPYNADLDFGTGDFHFMGWLIEQPNSAVESIFSRGAYSGGWSGSTFILYVKAAGTIEFIVTDDAFATYDTITSSATVDDGVPRLVSVVRRGANVELWLNDAKAAADVPLAAAVGSLSNATATMIVGGEHPGNTNPLTNGTLALHRAGAGAPSAEQIAKIYRDELPLFQANAACTLAGSSNAVLALAHDDETDQLHVATSYGRSTFHGLELIDSEATAVGTIAAIAASGGVIAQAGSTAVDVYVPAMSLRDELQRTAEQAAAFGSALEPIRFTATASQTAFELDVGWKPKAVYRNGLLLWIGSTEDYTEAFNGFFWTVTLADASVSGDQITIMGVRSNG